MKKRPSFTSVIALLALFIAIGGTATAAGLISGKSIKRGTITAKQIKKEAVTGAKIMYPVWPLATWRSRACHCR